MEQTKIKKIKLGERLQTAMIEMAVGESLEIPYKFYSANTIRATASQLKLNNGLEYEVNTRGDKLATITRLS